MSIKVITNTCWENSDAQVWTAGLTSISGAANNLTFGTRAQNWKHSYSSASDHLNYKRSTNAFEFDTLVLGAASGLIGQEVTFRSYNGSSWENHNTTTISAANLTGIDTTDYIVALSTPITGKQLVGITYSTAISKPAFKLCKFYVGEAYTFSYPMECRISRASRYNTIYIKRIPFSYIETATFTFAGVTSALYQQFEQLFRIHTDACFFYDSNADYLRDKLWHCVVGPVKVVEQFNDLYTLNIPLYRLRSYAEDDYAN